MEFVNTVCACGKKQIRILVRANYPVLLWLSCIHTYRLMIISNSTLTSKENTYVSAVERPPRHS
jgi:hypothetical protein